MAVPSEPNQARREMRVQDEVAVTLDPVRQLGPRGRGRAGARAAEPSVGWRSSLPISRANRERVRAPLSEGKR
jgi:hypothetical protein